MKYNGAKLLILLVLIASVSYADIGALLNDVVHTVEDGVRVATSLGNDEQAVADLKRDAQGVVDNLDNTFGKDGDVTIFAESLPIAGYLASAGHALVGDDQRAKYDSLSRFLIHISRLLTIF